MSLSKILPVSLLEKLRKDGYDVDGINELLSDQKASRCVINSELKSIDINKILMKTPNKYTFEDIKAILSVKNKRIFHNIDPKWLGRIASMSCCVDAMLVKPNFKVAKCIFSKKALYSKLTNPDIQLIVDRLKTATKSKYYHYRAGAEKVLSVIKQSPPLLKKLNIKPSEL